MFSELALYQPHVRRGSTRVCCFAVACAEPSASKPKTGKKKLADANVRNVRRARHPAQSGVTPEAARPRKRSNARPTERTNRKAKYEDAETIPDLVARRNSQSKQLSPATLDMFFRHGSIVEPGPDPSPSDEPDWSACELNGQKCRINEIDTVVKKAPERVLRCLVAYENSPLVPSGEIEEQLRLAMQNLFSRKLDSSTPKTKQTLEELEEKTCCPTCNGSGWETCEYCGGRGIIHESEYQQNFKSNRIMVYLPIRLTYGNLLRCPLCGGLRKERCSQCFGYGDLQVAQSVLEELNREQQIDPNDAPPELGNMMENEARDQSIARFRELERKTILTEQSNTDFHEFR